MVSEHEIRSAMVQIYQEWAIVAEPSGAVAVAAAVRQSADHRGKVIAVLTGGNVNPEWFRSIVETSQLRLSPMTG
jgi:threonine dehydratase